LFLVRNRFTISVLTVLNIAFVVPLLIYTGAGIWFTRYAYDDYCQAVIPREFGLLGGVVWVYNHLSGRFFAFFLNGIMAPLGTPVGTLMMMSLVWVWWLALFAVLRQLLCDRPYALAQAGLAASVLIVTTITCLPNIPMALYAYNGTSIYLTPVMLFTVLIGLIFQDRLRNNTLSTVACALAAVGISAASDTAGVAQTLILTSVLLIHFRQHSSNGQQVVRIVAALTASIIGLVLVLHAPSNYLRAQYSPPPDLGFTFSAAVSSLGAPLLVALLRAPLALIAVFVIPAMAAYYTPFPVSNADRKRARLAILLIFSAAGVLTLTFFVPVAYFLSSGLVAHAWLPPVAVLIFATVSLGYASGLALRRQVRVLPKSTQIGLLIGSVLLAVLLTFQAFSTASIQQRYVAAWDRRDVDIRTRIRTGEGSTHLLPFTNPYYVPLTIDPATPVLIIDSLRNISPYKWEADANPATLTNYCLARFYGVAAVVAMDNVPQVP